MIDAHSALIYTMVLMSAADRNMTDAELHLIGDVTKHLPVFRAYDQAKLPGAAEACAELLASPNGLDKALELIFSSLPKRLHETAYALACDVAAADAHASQEELRVFVTAYHDPACSPATVLYAIVSHPEYHRY